MIIVFAICLLVYLFLAGEAVRRWPIVHILIFMVLPLAATPYWIVTNSFTWFEWVNIYSVVMACAWLFFHRYKYENTKDFSKIITFLFLVVNILVAVIRDFQLGNSFNAVAGIILILTLGMPSKIKVDIESRFKDLSWNIPFVWIAGYTIWSYVFVASNYAKASLIHIIVLLVPLIISFFHRKLWAQARAFSLGLYMLLFATVRGFVESISFEWFNLQSFSKIMGIISFCFMATYITFTLFNYGERMRKMVVMSKQLKEDRQEEGEKED